MVWEMFEYVYFFFGVLFFITTVGYFMSSINNIVKLIFGKYPYDITNNDNVNNAIKDDNIAEKPEIISNEQYDRIIVKYKGNEYDITKYAKKHPGGKQILIDNNGNDVEELMENIGHSENAYQLLEKYKIV